jgi:hypothetical protein
MSLNRPRAILTIAAIYKDCPYVGVEVNAYDSEKEAENPEVIRSYAARGTH